MAGAVREELIMPTCDDCGLPQDEDFIEWCGTCGNCKEHCVYYVDCEAA